MKKISGSILLWAAFLIFSGIAIAGDAPKLTDAQKLAIRSAQVDAQNIQLQMNALIQQWPEYQHYIQLTQQSQAANAKINQAVKAAFAGAGIKEEDFTLDANLDLVAKPKEAKPDSVPSPTPAKK